LDSTGFRIQIQMYRKDQHPGKTTGTVCIYTGWIVQSYGNGKLNMQLPGNHSRSNIHCLCWTWPPHSMLWKVPKF